MADRFQMSPELRELLGELAQDDSAKLLRVPPESIWPESQEQRPHVGASAPFLKAAERKLLEVHREEAARLLYEYFLVSTGERADFGAYAHYGDGMSPPLKADIDAQSQCLLKELSEPAGEREALRLLASCLSSRELPEPLEVVGAAIRLAPSTKLRIGLGVVLILHGADYRKPEEILRQSLTEAGSGTLASYSWENLGLLFARQGLIPDAADCYGRAVLADNERVVPKLAWLRFLVLSCQPELARRAATAVDESVPPDDKGVLWYATRAKTNNTIVSTPDAVNTRRELLPYFGPTSLLVTKEYA